MKIKLIVFGDTYVSPVAEIFSMYSERIQRYYAFETIILKAGTAEEEGSALLKRIEQNSMLILLDEKGKAYTSVEFAHQLNKWLQTSSRQLIFAIGGAFGFHSQVFKRASSVVSLSKMTMPHQLVRAVFAEQLYRACTILRNEKYHH